MQESNVFGDSLGAKKKPVDNCYNYKRPPPPYYIEDKQQSHHLRPSLACRLIPSPQQALSLGLSTALAVLVYLSLIKDNSHHHRLDQDGSISLRLERFDAALQSCAASKAVPTQPPKGIRTKNPRWNPSHGQSATIILRNATLFDGESTLDEPMDIEMRQGLITRVVATSSETLLSEEGDAEIVNLYGLFVTPGLVDMHSHHSIGSWPLIEEVTSDENELSEGAIAPFLRVLDGLKASDDAFRIIVSGGITTSLILPGSANIMGGEAVPIKNAVRSGPSGEFVVDDLLLQHGAPEEETQRYLKIACGENPKQLYKHSRMANAWELREHFSRGIALMRQQDEYCAEIESVALASLGERADFIKTRDSFPFDMRLESTVALLRGQAALHSHNYLPEDMETLMRVTDEFGVRIHGLHHATEAWQVPGMLKASGHNVTIATFAEFSLYKWESYHPSLAAGKILNDNGIPVAYKSDHMMTETNAKYLMYQAAVGHAFQLPEDKSLQAVTSTPAEALEQGHRVGYARPSYDADIVVWNLHPLSIGATPLQVYIDGVAQLDQKLVKNSMGESVADAESHPRPRPTPPVSRPETEVQAERAWCSDVGATEPNFIISGLTTAWLEGHPELPDDFSCLQGKNLTLVLEGGKITCLDIAEACRTVELRASQAPNVKRLTLSKGHVLPGLTAVTASLGITEIVLNPGAGDGAVNPFDDCTNPNNVNYAKYGVQLEGKHFARARLGGVTRAITPPLNAGGLLTGVSVGITTDTNKVLNDGGVFRSEVALHAVLDSDTIMSQNSISAAVQKIRNMLESGKGRLNETVFGEVARGSLPFVIHSNNHWDIRQVIAIQEDFADANIVLLGGSEASLVAEELARAEIPVILTENRPAPDEFRHRDATIGPPLTPSNARALHEAGVRFSVSIMPRKLPADYRLHAIPWEASWAAKFAGLGQQDAVRLVSSNVEDILGLPRTRDIVIWEANPLEFGAAVALIFSPGVGDRDGKDGSLHLVSCWPGEHDI